MHTRRVGAFLVGGWLLGTLLMWFVTTQSYAAVDRSMSNPPPQMASDIAAVGPDAVRQMLRLQAWQFSRHVKETWEMLQLGIGGALLVTSFLTAHRSRILIFCTIAMLGMVAIMAFVLTPMSHSLGRSLDLIPPDAATTARDALQQYAVWNKVLEVLKIALGVVVTGRLLFDRYNWRDKLVSTKKRHRRTHRPSEASRATAAPAGSDPGTPAASA